jgi:hypothetical protein
MATLHGVYVLESGLIIQRREETGSHTVRFQVLTAASMKVSVF